MCKNSWTFRPEKTLQCVITMLNIMIWKCGTLYECSLWQGKGSVKIKCIEKDYPLRSPLIRNRTKLNKDWTGSKFKYNKVETGLFGVFVARARKWLPCFLRYGYCDCWFITINLRYLVQLWFMTNPSGFTLVPSLWWFINIIKGTRGNFVNSAAELCWLSPYYLLQMNRSTLLSNVFALINSIC